jgi:hypothetical protein
VIEGDLLDVTCIGDTVRRYASHADMAERAVALNARRRQAKADTGLSCDQCIDVVASGETKEEALERHRKCHGYTHCGPCCGPCPYCEPGADW